MLNRKSLIIASMFLISLSSASQAGTLENLERERAIVLEQLLDPSLSAAEHQAKGNAAKRRLVDMERQVLRDGSLKGRNTPSVRKAFSNYDLTFLIHASAEKKQYFFDLWLEQVGISTETLMAARVGRK
jgi:hypothetical protein